jgi:hypothetical protein
MGVGNPAMREGNWGGYGISLSDSPDAEGIAGLEATGQMQDGVDHRPAELYRFLRRSAV